MEKERETGGTGENEDDDGARFLREKQKTSGLDLASSLCPTQDNFTVVLVICGDGKQIHTKIEEIAFVGKTYSVQGNYVHFHLYS